MKIFANHFFVLIVYLLGISIAFAKPNPPVPTYKIPPAPPGLPIDENLFVLLIIAILLGIYIIFRRQSKTKVPI